MSLSALIVAQRAEHGIPRAVACRALEVSQAWFYEWRHGDVSRRRRRRTVLAVLAALVADLFAKHHGSYGCAGRTSR